MNDWDDTVSYGVGASWLAATDLTFHAGYAFVETPIPDHSLAPSLVDTDRHAFSLGFSWLRAAHRFDLSGTYSIHDDRDIASSSVPFYNGTYEMTSLLFGIAYAYTY